MKLVYPPDRHRTYEPATFLVGSVAPGSVVRVNQSDPIPLSPSGFFSRYLPLPEAENHLVIESQQPGGDIKTVSCTLFRDFPLCNPVLPRDTDSLQAFALPLEDHQLRPGDVLSLACFGPSGMTVSADLPGLTDQSIHLSPCNIKPDNRVGVFAQLHQTTAPWPEAQLYTAHWVVPDGVEPGSAQCVRYQLQGTEQSASLVSRGKVIVMPSDILSYVQVVTPDAVARTDPETGARRTPLLQGTVLPVYQSIGNWIQVGYAHHHRAWVHQNDVKTLPAPPVSSVDPIRLVRASLEDDALCLDIPLNRAMPMEIKPSPFDIDITLYSAVSWCDFIHYQGDVLAHGLEGISWTQPEPDVFTLRIALTSPLYGLEYAYEEGLLRFRIRPRCLLPESPFVVVLDPGHGGSETGAHAPEGTPEKTLNLHLARLIQEILSDNPNIQCVLTRTADEEVSLEERVERAKVAGGHLLLSLHHNALPDGRNPQLEYGVSTFYYHAFALPIARVFQTALVKRTRFSDYGVLYDSLYLCRPLAMPSLLLELGFLTYSEDAERCLDLDHQRLVAQSIAEAIKALSLAR